MILRICDGPILSRVSLTEQQGLRRSATFIATPDFSRKIDKIIIVPTTNFPMRWTLLSTFRCNWSFFRYATILQYHCLKVPK